MRKIRLSLLIITAFAVAVHIGLGVACGGTPPDLKVNLSFVDQNDSPIAKSVFVLGQDSIRMAVYLQYVGQDDLVASEIFARKRFHLCLRFTYVGPDGKERLVTADNREDAGDPPPPTVKLIGNQLLQMELVEVFTSGWVWKVAFDVDDHYDLPGAGNYSVEALIPITTYLGSALRVIDGKKYARITDADWVDPIGSRSLSFSIVTDGDGDTYYFPAYAGRPADCDDSNAAVYPGAPEIENNGIDDDCNPETPDVPEIPPGYILVEVDKHTVGLGHHPGSTKEDLALVDVKVFNKSEGSWVKTDYGVSWHYYESIFKSSEQAECTICQPVAEGETDASGTITLELPPGDYMVIGRYDPDKVAPGEPVIDGNEVYMGVSVGLVESGQTQKKYLQLIEKADGKRGLRSTQRRQGPSFSSSSRSTSSGTARRSSIPLSLIV